MWRTNVLNFSVIIYLIFNKTLFSSFYNDKVITFGEFIRTGQEKVPIYVMIGVAIETGNHIC